MKHEAYFESPYKYMGFEERFFTPKESEQITTDVNTGEMYSMRKIPKDRKIMHDSLVYTKIFQDSIHQLCSLSGPALKILLYAMATVKPLSQTVVLNGPDVTLFCDIGKSSFYDGMEDLLEKKIICKKLGSTIEFWFDPNVFFNGNRLRLI